MTGDTSVGLTLGGGGARGLAHVLALEAFDELGIRPCCMAGCSIGAIFGAAYAAGLPGSEIRTRTTGLLGKRTEIIRKLFATAPNSLSELWSLRPFSAALIRPEKLMEIVFDDVLPETFSALEIPFATVATDFNTQTRHVMRDGALLPAVAASMALPSIFRPVEHEGHVLIDGGLVDPLPFDLVEGRAGITVAVDVTGGAPHSNEAKPPSALEAILAASQIMQNAIVREKLQRHRPDILIRPAVDRFRVLEFYKVHDVLESAAALKDDLKRALDDALSAGRRKTP